MTAISADIARHLDDGPSVVAVVEGRNACLMRHYPHGPGCRTVPPTEFQGQPIGKCSCVKRGSKRYVNWHLWDSTIEPTPCTRCHDGDLTIELRVEDRANRHGPGTGFLAHTVTAVVRWVPVVDSRTPPESCPKSDYIEITESQRYASFVEYTSLAEAHGDPDQFGGVWDWRGLDPTLVAALEAEHGPADTWPGKYAIVAERVDQ